MIFLLYVYGFPKLIELLFFIGDGTIVPYLMFPGSLKLKNKSMSLVLQK